MRVAVLVIGLCLTAFIGLQSCTVMVGGTLTDDKTLSGGGATGILVALLFVIGASFAIGLPKVSERVFYVAAFLAFFVSSRSDYSDMAVWGLAALALAVMSHFGVRELKKRKREAATYRTEFP